MSSMISRSTPKSIQDLFRLYYVVPEFQREYVWKPENVKRLLDDILEARATGESEPYFIGSVVVFPEGPETFSLVDGQQRVTSIYIAFCAMRDHVVEVNPEADQEGLNACIAGLSVKKTGGTERRQRVAMQFEGDSEAIEAIGNGTIRALKLKARSPGRPLLDAYETVRTFCAEEFGGDLDALNQFVYYLLNQVEVIVVETANFVFALTIFERINSRGKALNAVDLLKNLLFKESENHHHAQVGREWTKLITLLRVGGEKNHLRFLRYFLVATEAFDRMPKAEEVYPWIAGQKGQLGISQAPVAFIKRMQTAAQQYVHLLAGRSPDGSESLPLFGIASQKTSVRQHLPILLAATHLRASEFERLSLKLESLALVFALSGAQWNEVEKVTPNWTKQLRGIRSPAELDEFIESSIDVVIRPKLPAAFAKLEHTGEMRPHLRKYLVARIAHHIDAESGEVADFAGYLKARVTIEHILPQSSLATGASIHFGGVEASRPFVHKLGNLTLLAHSANASTQDAAFEQKRESLEQSKYFLTKMIVRDVEIGRSTKAGRTQQRYGLHGTTTWNADSVNLRHAAMLKVVQAVWDL